MTVILGCKKGSSDAAVSALRLFNLTYFKSWLICFIVIIIIIIVFIIFCCYLNLPGSNVTKAQFMWLFTWSSDNLKSISVLSDPVGLPLNLLFQT